MTSIRICLLAAAAPALAWSAPAAAQQGVTDLDRYNVVLQQEYFDRVDADFAEMEAARLRGDCESFRRARDGADQLLNGESPNSIIKQEQIAPLARRLVELEARPCPPSGTEPTSAFRPQSVLRPKRLAAIHVGVGRSDTPQTGIGFRREGAPGEASEEFAGTSPTDVSTRSFEAGLQLGRIGIHVKYIEGDGTSRFDIPGDTGVDSGVVYGGLSPSGSSGIATPFGLAGEVSSDFRAWHFDARYRLLGGGGAGSSRSTDVERAAFELNAIFGYWLREGQYRGSASYSGAIDDDPYTIDYNFSQMREQSLDEDVFEAGLSGTAWFVPSAPVRPYVSLDASIYRRSTDLRSVETNTDNFAFCEGPCDENRVFMLMFEESDDGIGFHGTATAGVEVDIGRYLALNLGVEADYRSEVGSVWNPNSGDQVYYDGLTTRLVKEHVWSRRFFLGARLRF